MDFRTACEETKTGICLLQDGNQEPFKVRLHLAKDILMIQEQDVICVSGKNGDHQKTNSRRIWIKHKGRSRT
ncbi:syntrophin gamma 1 [Homo sapiens]|uniref:Syntrophin gamma 1 n=1 Tax=Homo sapiens TaxID=9606 RepID=A0A2R8Y457_HUMAN|nr:syntrophin gamma 1 [Homo sapiens]KAI4010592.1 syntrophin gamma 1 [Homo sapiens]